MPGNSSLFLYLLILSGVPDNTTIYTIFSKIYIYYKYVLLFLCFYISFDKILHVMNHFLNFWCYHLLLYAGIVYTNYMFNVERKHIFLWIFFTNFVIAKYRFWKDSSDTFLDLFFELWGILLTLCEFHVRSFVMVPLVLCVSIYLILKFSITNLFKSIALIHKCSGSTLLPNG